MVEDTYFDGPWSKYAYGVNGGIRRGFTVRAKMMMTLVGMRVLSYEAASTSEVDVKRRDSLMRWLYQDDDND